MNIAQSSRLYLLKGIGKFWLQHKKTKKKLKICIAQDYSEVICMDGIILYGTTNNVRYIYNTGIIFIYLKPAYMLRFAYILLL